jgi:8-oxo-dGTP diphosphatase
MIVVAAVIEQDGRFLIARRLAGTHLAGCWEFPGGKVHEGEDLVEALQREIREELQTEFVVTSKIYQTTHAYQDRAIELHFFRGTLGGVPQPAIGQELRWITREDFPTLEFPPADAALLVELAHSRL